MLVMGSSPITLLALLSAAFMLLPSMLEGQSLLASSAPMDTSLGALAWSSRLSVRAIWLTLLRLTLVASIPKSSTRGSQLGSLATPASAFGIYMEESLEPTPWFLSPHLSGFQGPALTEVASGWTFWSSKPWLAAVCLHFSCLYSYKLIYCIYSISAHLWQVSYGACHYLRLEGNQQAPLQC